MDTTTKRTEALVITSKEISLEVNADKSKYTVISRDQNAGQNRNLKIGNKLFERMEQFKYFEKTFSDQNSIHEENKSLLNSGNACFHSVQNPFSSSLLSKSVKVKISRSIILPAVLYGCKTFSH
jgi:hypothetical protein